jgi:transposase
MPPANPRGNPKPPASASFPFVRVLQVPDRALVLGWTAPFRRSAWQDGVVDDLKRRSRPWKRLFVSVLDTSKSVFQLHGVDGMEQPVLRRKLRRGQVLAFFGRLPPALVAMEACGASHYWARELRSLGHEVAMIPPQYVKPYVQRGKSDAADAEAICEAASRPKLQKNYVPIKSPEQQGAQMLTRVRNQFIGRRTQLANSIRGYAAEFGFTAPKGLSRLPQLLIDIRADATVPDLAMELIEALAAELARVDDQIVALDKKLMQLHRSSEMSRRLATIPGIGPIGATLLSIKVVDARGFKSARNFAAWLGLTPKNHSTAGKNRLGVITRAGDGMLRTVLVAGATAVIADMRRRGSRPWSWLKDMIARKPPKLVAIALANKLARIAWKLMVSGERYRPASAVPMPTPT